MPATASRASRRIHASSLASSARLSVRSLRRNSLVLPVAGRPQMGSQRRGRRPRPFASGRRVHQLTCLPSPPADGLREGSPYVHVRRAVGRAGVRGTEPHPRDASPRHFSSGRLFRMNAVNLRVTDASQMLIAPTGPPPALLHGPCLNRWEACAPEAHSAAHHTPCSRKWPWSSSQSR